MLTTIPSNKTYPFLQGGGEMGKLTRNHDWSKTAVGSPDEWPQSLRTTVSNLLRSRFPMFLWWGEEMIQFYNDAYRPSLGNNGKHPFALGQKGKECWPEIWEIVHPLMEQVRTTGEATWREDQLVPIYRNGKIEDVYWTYSYSSVLDDDGIHAGILVTCVETTEKVLNSRRIEESEKNLRNIILQSPVAMCMLAGPGHVVDIANDRMFELWGKQREEVMHKTILEGLPEIIDQGFNELLDNVYTTGETYTAFGVPVSLVRNGTEETVYVNFVYEAYRKKDEIAGVMVVATEVTELVDITRKIEQSEQQVRSLVESAPFPIGVYIGREMRISLVNQAILDAWGRGSEVLGKTYAEVLPELEGQSIYEKLDKVYTTGIPFHAKNQRVELLVDGRLQPFYFNYSFTPLFDSEGKVYGVMNTAADVTDLNVAKHKAEQSERNFRNLVMQAPVGICIVSGEDRIVEVVNDSFLEVVRKNRKAFEGTAYWASIPEAAAMYTPVLDNVFTSGIAFRGQEHELSLVRNGREEILYVNFVYDPIKEEDGTVSKVMILVIEVTPQVLARRRIEEVVAERTRELQRSRQEIEDSSNRLNAVFNHAQSGMFTFAPVWDAKGEIIDFRFVITNPNFAAYVGQTPEVLKGELGSTWFPGYLTNGVFDMYKKTWLTGETQRQDMHYNVDGHDLYLDLRSTKVGEEVLVTFTDYTALKRAQFDLERSVEELKRSNQNLEEFAYAASHDLKEPIRKIHFFSSRIKDSLSSQFMPEQLRYFSRMEEAAKRMGQLIDDLLSYSQISLRPRSFEEVNMNRLLETVLLDLDLEIEQKGAVVEVEELFTIQGHQRQLQQAFQNLLGNALKYSKPGVPPRVSIGYSKTTGKASGLLLSPEEQQESFYVISIRDNGIGFDQQDAERIFTVFTRLHGNAEFKGTGIGLSIVRKVMENHGGYVMAQSSPGEGAEFKVFLPVSI